MAALTINADDLLSLARARATALGQFGGLDAKRPAAWDQYGYKQTLVFDDYLQAYERGGAAYGAVHRTLEKCWQDMPRIKKPASDAETPFEATLADQLRALKVWQKFRDFDRRNLVGHYAGLIYRVADGLDLREPLGRGALVDVVPVFEDQLRVTDWNSDTASPDYGKPRMWQYRARRFESNATEARAAPDKWVDVHPTRLQILAEGCSGDDFTQGVPLLRAGYNCLVDIEKVRGGAGESFLKNSQRTLSIEFAADASPQVIATNEDGTPSGKSVRSVLSEQVDAMNRNIDAALVTQGAKATTLQTTQSDPEKPWNVAANEFAASVLMPFTVLFGQQTGRLASDQDQKDWNARCHGRRVNTLTPAIEEFITRGQAAGWFEAGAFEVEWPALDAPGEEAKLDHGKKMAEIAETASRAGITEPVYDANEIRKATGYEERADDGMPTEGDPIDDPALDPLADPAAQPPRVPAVRRAA